MTQSSTDGDAVPPSTPKQTDTNAPGDNIEQEEDVPPQYSSAHGTTPTSEKPVPEPHVEEEWQATLHQLKVNLAALREAEKSPTMSPFLIPSAFVQSLFQSKAKVEASRRGAEAASSNTQDRQERIRMLQGLIIGGMLKLASIHPDPSVKAEWNGRAAEVKETFDNPNATEAEKESVLEGIGKGVGILLITPFLLVGGAIFTVGAVLGGVGKTLSGIGRVITGIQSN